MISEARINLRISSCFVVPPPPKSEPPPMPGTVTAEMLKPKVDNDLPFLVPWKTFTETPRTQNQQPIPVMVDTKTLSLNQVHHGVEATLSAVFRSHPEEQQLIEAVMLSMENPFATNKSPIVWSIARDIFPNPDVTTKLGGKKLQSRHRILQGNPWSIKCFGEKGIGPRRNMIYGPEGKAIAQIDFGHSSVGVHAHALVYGSLDHTPVADPEHLFRLRTVPWAWTVIPEPPQDKESDSSGTNVDEYIAFMPNTSELDECEGWSRISMPFDDYSMGSRSFS